MIISFQHKGLEHFYLTGSGRGIQTVHTSKLRRILAVLDVAEAIDDLNFPAFQLHQLKGDLKSFWSIRVSGSWRIIFRFSGKDVELVDYVDYH
jgi:proteic killer suppression protein